MEKENFAKNSETKLIYEQLESLRDENEALRSMLQGMKDKWDEERGRFEDRVRQAEQVSTRDFGGELRNSVDLGSLKAVAEDMRIELEAKDEEIATLIDERNGLQAELQGYQDEIG